MHVLNLLKRQLEVHRELRRLDKHLSFRRGVPVLNPMPTIVRNHPQGLVWELHVPHKPNVYMRLPIPTGASDYVVYVSAISFYRAWLALPQDHARRCPIKSEMRNDYKFRYACDRFIDTEKNPVPIAEVVPGPIHKGRRTIDFRDGMTRSLWLLTNDVAVFPVLCDNHSDARSLMEIAGIAQPTSLV
ncbi:plasmid fertility inhibition factor family protein [Ochrobactrum teleogrylli]|uniref:plasmid fertility inhibition factor family protein n=1 Tax=Ochrobactrum teleogrylli TaxID=2479765 RepID=UPI0015DF221C|nr:hypothetical protein [[Ochrobactrum] teleogrylli]